MQFPHYMSLVVQLTHFCGFCLLLCLMLPLCELAKEMYAYLREVTKPGGEFVVRNFVGVIEDISVEASLVYVQGFCSVCLYEIFVSFSESPFDSILHTTVQLKQMKNCDQRNRAFSEGSIGILYKEKYGLGVYAKGI